MGATFGPAVIGEFLRHVMARNAALLSAPLTASDTDAAMTPLGQLYGMVQTQTQALVVSMKEIYGYLLIAALVALTVILVSYGPLRPWPFSPSGRPSAASSAVKRPKETAWSGERASVSVKKLNKDPIYSV